MTDDGQISALERLAKLRDSGSLTEDEYQKEKAKLLSGSGVPFYRRLWWVVLLTALIITFPIALIILLTGPVYRKSGGVRVPIQNRSRYIYAGALGLWLAAIVLPPLFNPQSVKDAWRDSASDDSDTATQPEQTASDDTNVPEACDDDDIADQIKSTVEDNAASKLVAVTVQDFGHPKELYYDKKNNIRMCQADAVLNTGATALSYNLFFGPSGKPMIEVKEGADAYVYELVKAAADQAAAAAQAKETQVQQSPPVATQPAPLPQQQAAPQQSADTSQPPVDTNSAPTTSDPIESHYSAAYAQCEKEQTGDNWSRAGEYACIDDERQLQEANLNQLYASIMGQLDSAGQARLRDLEQEWIKQREAECNPPAPAADMGNADEMVEPTCELEANVKRIIQLQRLEAASSGN